VECTEELWGFVEETEPMVTKTIDRGEVVVMMMT